MTSSRKIAEQAFFDDVYKEGEVEPLNGFYRRSAGVLEFEKRIYSGCEGKRILEYGCGMGSHAVPLAERGADVCGIDISPNAIERARAAAAGVTGGRTEFRVEDAENLDFDDASFDVVCGTGIIHHLDITRAMAEVRRVLRPGGRAVFYEPIAHNPLVNVYRLLTPSQHTKDEHPLTLNDIRDIGSRFSSLEAVFFDFFSIFAIPFLRVSPGMALLRALERADRALLEVGAMKRWGATAVLDCRI